MTIPANEGEAGRPSEEPQSPRVQLLCVVNYRLPPHDYRIRYAELTQVCDVAFALPERPEAAVKWHHVGFGEGLRPRDVLAFVELTRVLLAARGPRSIAHFFSTKLFLAGPVLARALGVRSIITVTGFGRTFSDRRRRYRLVRHLYRLLFRQAARCASRVLFQNGGDLEAMRASHPDLAWKFDYIGSATAAEGVAVAKQWSCPLRVVHVARLLETKGVLDFIEVARRTSPDVARFTLVGPASASEPETAKAVSDAHAAGIVEYAGQLPAAALATVYERSHVVLFLSHAEGMPRVLLEAGVHGLCPVAYDIPANRDLIGPGRGVLVPVGDIAQLVERLAELARPGSGGEQQAVRFKSFVREEFTAERYTTRLDAAITGSFAVASDRGRRR